VLSIDISRPVADASHCQHMVISMKMDRSTIPFLKCLLQCDTHRGTQGRLIRRLVFSTLASCVFVASRRAYSFASQFFDYTSATIFACAIAATGTWAAYRLVQYQPVADFLIDVQLESLKVTWSTWQELRRTTGVVLAAMVVFSAYLFACDVSWQILLRSLSVLSV